MTSAIGARTARAYTRLNTAQILRLFSPNTFHRFAGDVFTQAAANTPVTNGDILDRALNAALGKRKSEFQRLWRAAMPNMDERVGTTLIYNFIRGFAEGFPAGQLNQQAVDFLRESLRAPFMARGPTAWTGWNTEGEAFSFQHPTAPDRGVFRPGRGGQNHPGWDRSRGEFATAIVQQFMAPGAQHQTRVDFDEELDRIFAAQREVDKDPFAVTAVLTTAASVFTDANTTAPNHPHLRYQGRNEPIPAERAGEAARELARRSLFSDSTTRVNQALGIAENPASNAEPLFRFEFPL